MKKHIRKISHENGMAAIMTVLVIGMACLAMSISATLVGLNGMDMSYSSDKGNEALSLADGCAEDALRRLKAFASTTPAEYTLNSPNGLCTITMTDNTTLDVAAVVDGYTKRIRADISVNGAKVSLIDWREE